MSECNQLNELVEKCVELKRKQKNNRNRKESQNEKLSQN